MTMKYVPGGMLIRAKVILLDLQIPNHFDDNIILRQLRYTGMLETVRIRRAGYSVRIEYEVGDCWVHLEVEL